MKVNLHTHTFLCGHATGTPEEYIQRAIENKVKVLGFSEHAPFVFPDGYESGHRVPLSKAKEYMDTLNFLREKYKDKIKIYIGFEMEYYPLYFEDMYKTIKELGAEYLILGQHFVKNEHPDGHYIGMIERPMSDLTRYVNCVIEGMNTGIFTYIAHPDLIEATSDMPFYRKEMTRLCEEAKKCDIPLEINFYGIRDHRFYPFEEFWRIAGQIGCKTVFGFDSHDTLSAFDDYSIPFAEKIVSKYGLTLVKEPEIIPLPGRF